MRPLAGAFLVVGLGSELFGLISQDGSAAIAQVLGFSILTLAMILMLLGTRAIRNLVS
jgi:hypothetical protein